MSFYKGRGQRQSARIVLVWMLTIASMVMGAFLYLTGPVSFLVLFPYRRRFSAVYYSCFLDFRVLSGVPLAIGYLCAISSQLLVTYVVISRVYFDRFQFLLKGPLTSIYVLPSSVAKYDISLYAGFRDFRGSASYVFLY